MYYTFDRVIINLWYWITLSHHHHHKKKNLHLWKINGILVQSTQRPKVFSIYLPTSFGLKWSTWLDISQFDVCMRFWKWVITFLTCIKGLYPFLKTCFDFTKKKISSLRSSANTNFCPIIFCLPYYYSILQHSYEIHPFWKKLCKVIYLNEYVLS